MKGKHFIKTTDHGWRPWAIWGGVLTAGSLILYLQYAIQWPHPRWPWAAFIHGIWCDAFDCWTGPSDREKPYWIRSHQLKAHPDQPNALELELTIVLSGHEPMNLPPIQIEFINLHGESHDQNVIPIQDDLIHPPWNKVRPGVYALKFLLPDPGEEMVNYTVSFISPPQLDTMFGL